MSHARTIFVKTTSTRFLNWEQHHFCRSHLAVVPTKLIDAKASFCNCAFQFTQHQLNCFGKIMWDSYLCVEKTSIDIFCDAVYIDLTTSGSFKAPFENKRKQLIEKRRCKLINRPRLRLKDGRGRSDVAIFWSWPFQRQPVMKKCLCSEVKI